MLIKRISIFDDFKCLAGDCPASCCRGWKIPVDDKTYMKYLGQKGLLGTALRCAIKKEDETVAFKNWHNKCPFWGTDRLCFLQKKYGLEYMPLVCIQFPRQLYNLGEFCEEILYLACPEAARLFLVHVDDEMPLILKRYYEYFLLSDFLDIYEDYSFSKHIKFGIDKTNLLLVFVALYAKDRRTLSLDELTKLIAVFERRAPQIR